MRPGAIPGKLVMIGGAEDRTGECKILREFVRLAGGCHSRIAVITVASEMPAEVGASYVRIFERLGAEHARVFPISTRDDSNSRNTAEALDKVTAVFFTGGNQVRITSLLGGTRMDTALHKRHEEGMVLGGTSAGASMMSSTMIIGGMPETTLRLGIVELGPGMEFIPGVLIDQHFEERGRLRRLLSAVAQHPHQLGLGIDEDTALVVSDGQFEVIGEGTVTVIDAGALIYTNLSELKKNEILALSGIRLHILPAGYRFDLQRRKLLLNADPCRGGGPF